MKQFLSDSQQEDCLQDIGEVVTSAIRRARLARRNPVLPPLAPAPTAPAATASAPPAEQGQQQQIVQMPPDGNQAQMQFYYNDQNVIYDGNGDYRVL